MKDYQPSLLFRNAHINTCYPTFFRKIDFPFTRKRLYFPGGDFLDLDCYQKGKKRALVLCHGLEGSAHSHYIQAFAKYFSARDWDILAINYRSCSGEVNPKAAFYVSGKGDEIERVLEETEGYESLVLLGFSLGANKVLDFMGRSKDLPEQIKGAVAVAPPCDLRQSADFFTHGMTHFYELYFLRSLKEKMRAKAERYPHIFDHYGISMEEVEEVTSFYDFDTAVTAKLGHYKGADDYYRKNSSLYVLGKIDRPSLILTAKDDPMMSPNCYPWDAVKKNPYLQMHCPDYGGHISYASTGEAYWLEKYVFAYIEKNILKA